MKILTLLFVATSVAGALLLAAGVASWAMAQGILRPGSMLHRAASRLLQYVDWLAVGFFALLLGAAVMSGRARRNPVRDQIRAHAARRRAAREVRSGAARKLRELDAAADGTVTEIRVTADNRIEAIRANVEGMSDAELTEAAREVGR